MTKLNQVVEAVMVNKVEEMKKAGLIATAQVKRQVLNRAVQILETKVVDGKVHKNTVNAAIRKAIKATAKFAAESVNPGVIYLVREGETQNIGIALGWEMAGNIDIYAYESVIALALSNGVTTEYPEVVAKAKGMAKIEERVIEVLEGHVSVEGSLLTIGAYVFEIKESVLADIMADVVDQCAKVRNGAVKKMTKYLADKSVEQAREVGVAEEQIIKTETELEVFFEAVAEEGTSIDLNASTVEQPVTVPTEQPQTTTPVVETDEVKAKARFKKNVKYILQFVKGIGLSKDQTDAIMAQIITDNKERLEKIPFSTKLDDLVTPVVMDAVEKLFPENKEKPANGETPAAEPNKESEETVVKEETSLDRVKEFVAELEASYQKHIADIMEKHTELVNQYEAKILDVSQKFQYMEDENAKLKKELEIAKKDLIKQTTLRKADAHKMTKLEKEVGRVKVQLKEHKARKVSEDKVIEVPKDVEVGAVIKSRIKTAGAMDNAAQSIHKNAPEKIEAAAEKTKDGIQWVADRAKDTVDGAAKLTNWSTEKLGNSITLAADVIAPSKEAVAKSALRKTPADGEKPFVIIGGNKFYKEADGTLRLGK